MSSREKFEQMIRSPDWAMVAEVLGDVPSRLRELYKSDMVLQSDWEVVTDRSDDDGAYEISEFEALRPELREEMWPELREGCLTFAGDGCGNQFFLRADTGPMWPVHHLDHETGEVTLIADSLEAFLLMLRPFEDDE